MRGSRQGWLAATLLSLALGLNAIAAGDAVVTAIAGVSLLISAACLAGLGRA